MKQVICAVLFVGLVSCNTGLCIGQEAADGHAVLKKDVGTWKAAMKMWMAPGTEPQMMEGKEVNSMVGDYWVVSDFKGNFGGMDFKGHGVFGYDAKSKKYTGSWVDSSNPNAMHMIGTYDSKTKTMTLMTKGVEADGSEMEGKAVTVYKEDGSRVYTMYRKIDGEMSKVMEIVYTKVK